MDVNQYNSKSFLKWTGLILIAYYVYRFFNLVSLQAEYGKYVNVGGWSWVSVIFSALLAGALLIGTKMEICALGALGGFWIISLVNLCILFSVGDLFNLLFVELLIIFFALVMMGLVKELDFLKTYIRKFWWVPAAIFFVLQFIFFFVYMPDGFGGVCSRFTWNVFHMGIVLFESLWIKYALDSQGV